MALRSDEALHGPAAVRRQAVPDERHLGPIEVVAQLEEELHEQLVVVGPGGQAEDEGGIRGVGAEAQSRGHRQALPMGEAVLHHWRTAPAGPGGPDARDQAEAALVLEDDPRVPGPGVFFTLGQRSFTQRSMAASSRSTTRRAGRWRLQPIWRSTRQTCPGW